MDLLYVLLPFLAFALGVQSVQCTSTSSCLDRCKFDTDCETFNYIQHSPCSYSCVCDGQYTYYEEKDFKRCGTDKRCYQGDCLDEVYDNCKYIYGSHFIGLINIRNPCSYNCFDPREPCNVYEEYFPEEYRCYNTYSNTLGQCCDGRCITGGKWITNKKVSGAIDGSGVRVTLDNDGISREIIGNGEITEFKGTYGSGCVKEFGRIAESDYARKSGAIAGSAKSGTSAMLFEYGGVVKSDNAEGSQRTVGSNIVKGLGATVKKSSARRSGVVLGLTDTVALSRHADSERVAAADARAVAKISRNEGIVKSANAGGSERTDESYSAQGSAITVKKGSGGGLGVTLGLTDTVALSRHSDSEQVAAAYARASAAFSKNEVVKSANARVSAQIAAFNIAQGLGISVKKGSAKGSGVILGLTDTLALSKHSDSEQVASADARASAEFSRNEGVVKSSNAGGSLRTAGSDTAQRLGITVKKGSAKGSGLILGLTDTVSLSKHSDSKRVASADARAVAAFSKNEGIVKSGYAGGSERTDESYSAQGSAITVKKGSAKGLGVVLGLTDTVASSKYSDSEQVAAADARAVAALSRNEGVVKSGYIYAGGSARIAGSHTAQGLGITVKKGSAKGSGLILGLTDTVSLSKHSDSKRVASADARAVAAFSKNEGIVKSGYAGGSERTDESYSAQGSAITVKKGSAKGLGVVLGLTDTVASSKYSDSEQVAAADARAVAALSRNEGVVKSGYIYAGGSARIAGSHTAQGLGITVKKGSAKGSGLILGLTDTASLSKHSDSKRVASADARAVAAFSKNEGIVKSGYAGGSERTDESYSAQGSAITVKKGSAKGLGVVLGLTDTVASSKYSDSEQVAAADARAVAALSRNEGVVKSGYIYAGGSARIAGSHTAQGLGITVKKGSAKGSGLILGLTDTASLSKHSDSKRLASADARAVTAFSKNEGVVKSGYAGGSAQIAGSDIAQGLGISFKKGSAKGSGVILGLTDTVALSKYSNSEQVAAADARAVAALSRNEGVVKSGYIYAGGSERITGSDIAQGLGISVKKGSAKGSGVVLGLADRVALSKHSDSEQIAAADARAVTALSKNEGVVKSGNAGGSAQIAGSDIAQGLGITVKKGSAKGSGVVLGLTDTVALSKHSDSEQIAAADARAVAEFSKNEGVVKSGYAGGSARIAGSDIAQGLGITVKKGSEKGSGVVLGLADRVALSKHSDSEQVAAADAREAAAFSRNEGVVKSSNAGGSLRTAGSDTAQGLGITVKKGSAKGSGLILGLTDTVSLSKHSDSKRVASADARAVTAFSKNEGVVKSGNAGGSAQIAGSDIAQGVEITVKKGSAKGSGVVLGLTDTVALSKHSDSEQIAAADARAVAAFSKNEVVKSGYAGGSSQIAGSNIVQGLGVPVKKGSARGSGVVLGLADTLALSKHSDSEQVASADAGALAVNVDSI